MNPELTKQLVERYPSLMEGVGKPPSESCMAFGFECDDGWFHILDHIFYFLHRRNSKQLWIRSAHNDTAYVKVPAPKISLAQVKEKFGGLRVYTDIDTSVCSNKPGDSTELVPESLEREIERHNTETYGAILLAEYMAARTCEVTGNPGKLCSRHGWYKTLSLEKAIEYGYTHPDMPKPEERHDEISVIRDY